MAEEVPAFDPTLKKKKKSKSKPAFAADDEDSADTQTAPAGSIESGDAEGVTDMMAALSTKKKKKSKSSSSKDKKAGDNDNDDDEDVANPGGDGSAAFDAKKKKKKKKAAAADFDALLEKAGVSENAKEDSPETETTTINTSVNERGETDFTYEELLSRFFEILSANNPDLASDRSGHKFKIPPPEVKRDGKKSIFVNIKDISDRLHRPVEHVISFLYAELATTGSIDGSNRLVIKGRFQQKQIETVLRKYIVEYATCKTCKSINTKLRKENRLFFLDCNSCGSRRSVSSIKTGFQAVIKRQKPTS